jgi:zona occludens toxin
MIYGISGKTGGGKSYEAVVRHIIPTVTEQKRKVVTNLPLNIDHFCAVYGEYCRDLIEVIDGEFHNYGGQRPFSKKDHYLQYQDWQNENGQRVYFFIDECHLALPMSGTEKEVKEFYSMHRHYGFDIMLITQNFRKVDRDIRDLISNHYRAIKKSMLGQDDKYILKVHDGASSSVQSVVATHEREYESKYFKFYQSHTKSNQAVKEAASNDIKKWYDNWFIKGGVILLVLFVFMLWSGFNKQAEIEERKQKLLAGQTLQSQPSDSAVVVTGQRQ